MSWWVVQSKINSLVLMATFVYRRVPNHPHLRPRPFRTYPSEAEPMFIPWPKKWSNPSTPWGFLLSPQISGSLLWISWNKRPEARTCSGWTLFPSPGQFWIPWPPPKRKDCKDCRPPSISVSTSEEIGSMSSLGTPLRVFPFLKTSWQMGNSHFHHQWKPLRLLG